MTTCVQYLRLNNVRLCNSALRYFNSLSVIFHPLQFLSVIFQSCIFLSCKFSRPSRTLAKQYYGQQIYTTPRCTAPMVTTTCGIRSSVKAHFVPGLCEVLWPSLLTFSNYVMKNDTYAFVILFIYFSYFVQMMMMMTTIYGHYDGQLPTFSVTTQSTFVWLTLR